MLLIFATALVRSLARNAASIAQRLSCPHASTSVSSVGRKRTPQVHCGERWRAWLVDYNSAEPGDRVARASSSPGESSQSHLRLESARSGHGRVALSERDDGTPTGGHDGAIRSNVRAIQAHERSVQGKSQEGW